MKHIFTQIYSRKHLNIKYFSMTFLNSDIFYITFAYINMQYFYITVQKHTLPAKRIPSTSSAFRDRICPIPLLSNSEIGFPCSE